MLDDSAHHKILIGAITISLFCSLQFGIHPADARTVESYCSSLYRHSSSHNQDHSEQETDSLKQGNDQRRQLSGSQSERQIPGLYDGLAPTIRAIQGEEEFNRLILGKPGASDKDSANLVCDHWELDRIARSETISLVQFYMATCPDCQGFSPYFKRFASDIGPHWSKMVKLYVVNCNDFQNIHVCQEQNPRLIVPLVRWYTFPTIQFHNSKRTRKPGQPIASMNNSTRLTISGNQRNKRSYPLCKFSFGTDLLSISHRQFIDEQRRDLISLRHATLRYFDMAMRELESKAKNPEDGTLSSEYWLLQGLPPYWDSLQDLVRSHKSSYLHELERRLDVCWAKFNGTNIGRRIENFIIIEPSSSFIGRTLVADWSAHVYSSGDPERPDGPVALIHRTSDSSLLRRAKIIGLPEGDVREPILLHFSAGQYQNMAELSIKYLASNSTKDSDSVDEEDESDSETKPRIKRYAKTAPNRLERIDQRASLERFYSHLGASGNNKQPIKYAAAMSRPSMSSPFLFGSGHLLHKRHAQTGGGPSANRTRRKLENANWTPEWAYFGEERLRFEFNRLIASQLKLKGPEWPGSLLNGTHPGKIKRVLLLDKANIIDPVADDKAFMMLTDYYKGLEEIVNVDLLSKGSLDGYQMIAGSCFLRLLKNRFPFQSRSTPGMVCGMTTATYYIFLVEADWLEELERQLLSAPNKPLPSDRWANLMDRFTNIHVGCPNLNELASYLEHEKGGSAFSSAGRSAESSASRGSDSARGLRSRRARLVSNQNMTVEETIALLGKQLEQVHVPSRSLESIPSKIDKSRHVGLPPGNRLKWTYCAGSGAYLRGHTCSLWVIFHTLTVNEYLERLQWHKRLKRHLAPVRNDDDGDKADYDRLKSAGRLDSSSPDVEYKFQIDYSRKPRRACNPSSPDEALIQARSVDLFLNTTDYALANIINFVRFYLPCTNCAAHFSCMVEHTPDLHLGSEAEAADWHLLWLWEGHNRVNERTRGTHSEDPTRPKHIFPHYEACQQCYLERPAANASFTSMRFNRPELVKFIVARYRKSAIINNKLNIEDLYTWS